MKKLDFYFSKKAADNESQNVLSNSPSKDVNEPCTSFSQDVTAKKITLFDPPYPDMSSLTNDELSKHETKVNLLQQKWEPNSYGNYSFPSSEIWGALDSKKLTEKGDCYFEKLCKELQTESVHLKICKFSLGVGKRSTNMAVIGELGRYPLFIEVIVNMFSYLSRLTSTEDQLLSEALLVSKSLSNHRKSCQNKSDSANLVQLCSHDNFLDHLKTNTGIVTTSTVAEQTLKRFLVCSKLKYRSNLAVCHLAFFRRSLVENNKYVCPRDGDCKIINHKRANCSACRLKKCLELGMSKKAVRHGRYTVAIRTKTILEVKQLEREQALKDSFALADSFAKKLPEVISVPKSNPVPDSSVNDSIISSIIESSDNSTSFIESTNFTSNNTLQSSVIGSSLMSVTDSLHSAIGDIPENMTSLEPSSVFSQIETNKIFTDIHNLDILNTIDLDITNETIEISGSDVFLNELHSQTVDIDLTSDKIDFLEINPDEFIDLTQEVVDVLAPQTTTTIPQQQQSPQSIASSPSSIQQYSPDTTTLDESMSSQFGSSSTSSIELVSNASSSPPQKNSRSSFDLEDFNTTSHPQKKLRASFNLADDMEQLQLINTMVSAQEILYPEMRKYFNKEYTEVIHREFWEKTQLQTELFGQLKSLSTSEYNNFFLVTGIDVDGRRGMFTKVAECMQKEIVKYISFVKSIPGWEHINNSDKLTLIKASRFEYWLLGKFLSINPDKKFTADEKCGYTHTQVEQMWGSPENIEIVNNFTRKLKKLDLTFEEIALLRGVVVLSRDRCALREPELVEKMQWSILQSFIHLVKKTHPNEQLRFARCMDKLTQLRELTEVNYKANKNLENFQKSLIQNYPLLYECLTYEG
ncbi:unnamed protein product [Mytilus edulis]|uniref:Uncharacterized protein n=1 Tax=Mytilus edulis TaxID=6550 RepID=A0A8S3SYB0_MYTED|nr:unnamed protein product [Mytilus edulis]